MERIIFPNFQNIRERFPKGMNFRYIYPFLMVFCRFCTAVAAPFGHVIWLQMKEKGMSQIVFISEVWLIRFIGYLIHTEKFSALYGRKILGRFGRLIIDSVHISMFDNFAPRVLKQHVGY